MKIDYKNQKSPERQLVEHALRTATPEHPTTAQHIANVSGLSLATVRVHVSNCVNADLAYNVNGVGQVGAAYAWGIRPDPRRGGNYAQPRDGIPSGRYTGEKPAPTRHGAMDAYGLPTLSNGERIERKRPFIIGARAEQRV
jgi:hypothetical protein